MINEGDSLTRGSGFYVVAFGSDGRQVGISFWTTSRLSQKWMGICTAFLERHGAIFDTAWEGPLSHIRTKLTSASGAAIATFSVHQRIALSALLLRGQSPPAEAAVVEMFVRSLRETWLVQMARPLGGAFEEVFECKERPLVVVVPWAEAGVSEKDNDLVRELGMHVGGAFLLNEQPTV